MRPISVPVTFHTTSHPPTDEDVRQHRSIRLDALRTDPKSFLSTHAQESEVEPAEWRERLQQEGVWTFYAKFDEVNKYARPEPWLSTLTLLSPSFLTWFLSSSCKTPITTHTVSSPNPSWPLSLLHSGINLWLIVGLWVRPEWRRRGVAQKIVQKAVHSVRPDGAEMLETSAPDAYQSLSGSSNSKTTIILLEVYAHNRAAIELYRSVGFEILSNPDQPSCAPFQTMDTKKVRGRCKMEETHWMGYTIPPLLPHRSNL